METQAEAGAEAEAKVGEAAGVEAGAKVDEAVGTEARAKAEAGWPLE